MAHLYQAPPNSISFAVRLPQSFSNVRLCIVAHQHLRQASAPIYRCSAACMLAHGSRNPRSGAEQVCCCIITAAGHVLLVCLFEDLACIVAEVRSSASGGWEPPRATHEASCPKTPTECGAVAGEGGWRLPCSRWCVSQRVCVDLLRRCPCWQS